MANLIFTIADGKLTVGSTGRTNDYASTDYRAKAWSNGTRDGIRVYPISGDESKPRWSTVDYNDYSLVIDGAAYAASDGEDWVLAFNAACGTNIGYNTQYCQHIISDTIDMDTSVPLQLASTAEKAGYLTITAETDNSGDVYVGDEDVNNESYALEAGSSVFMELDDLSKIYAYASVASCQVKILGAYKY